MKTLKSTLAAIAAASAAVAGLDISGFVNVFPPDLSRWLVIIPSSAAVLVHITEAVLAHLDSPDLKPK